MGDEAAESKMKTREEYLLALGQALLNAVSDVFKAMDRDLLIAYGLAGALVIFDWRGATSFNFLGAQLSASSNQIFLLVPLVVALMYFLITFQLFRLAGLYHSLRDTADSLCSLNSRARPIALADMQHFESGIAGLVLALARWQATRLLRRNPFASPELGTPAEIGMLGVSLLRFAFRIGLWALSLLSRATLVLALLLLPVILSAHAIYFHALTTWPPADPQFMLLFIVVVFAGGLTFAFTIVLFSVAFVELLGAVRADLEESAKAVLQSTIGAVVRHVADIGLWPFR